jgi:hypothetical protein
VHAVVEDLDKTIEDPDNARITKGDPSLILYHARLFDFNVAQEYVGYYVLTAPGGELKLEIARADGTDSIFLQSPIPLSLR